MYATYVGVILKRKNRFEIIHRRRRVENLARNKSFVDWRMRGFNLRLREWNQDLLLALISPFYCGDRSIYCHLPVFSNSLPGFL